MSPAAVMTKVAKNMMLANLFVSSAWASGSRCAAPMYASTPPAAPVMRPRVPAPGAGRATVNAAAAGIASPSKTAALITPALPTRAAIRTAAREIPTGIWWTRTPSPTSQEVTAPALAPTPRTNPSARLWTASPRTKGPSACLWTCSSGRWCVWALVNASVRNRSANPPTNPATAVSPPSSRPSGKRSTNASASSIPAANAAERDRPLDPRSPPSKARRLAAEKPTAASEAIRIALTPATSHSPQRPRSHAPLPARRARPVNLEAVGTDLEVGADAGQILQVHRTPLELGDAPTTLTDEVVVVILGQLVARTVSKVEPAHEPKPGEKVERPVHRHHPNLGTAGPYLLHTLMPTGRDRRQNGQPLRRDLVPATTYLLNSRLEPHIRPLLIERVFHLQDSRNLLPGQSGRVRRDLGRPSRSAKSL